MRSYLWLGTSVILLGALALTGCHTTPVENSDLAQGPAPKRIASPARENCCYEDSLTGGQVFSMYCSYCHNAPNLSERNLANFKNVASHMRVRANLTGKEYARLMEFLQRWHDVPSPNPTQAPAPTRLTFSQPINELRPEPVLALPKPDKQP
jgi:hypothetical protein